MGRMRKKTNLFVRIGKPVFFVFSRIVIVFVFIFFLVKHILITPLKFTFLKLDFLKLRLFIEKIKPKVKFRFSFYFLLVFIITGLMFYFLILNDLPKPQDLKNRKIDVSTKIYDRNGKLLYKIYKDQNRTIISLDKIPTHVILATLAAEDAEFYNHNGFSIRGILRAFSQNIKGGNLQGGSTITQQLVKNALLTPEKTIVRKIKEIILSVEVEIKYSKDQILEMYLNEVSYGGTAYGIEEASYSYFGKSAVDLNLAEAALIAGLPKSPTNYSPFGTNPDLAIERQREVLRLMRINKYISEEQENIALNTPLTFSANRKEIKAPHFVMYVRQKLVDMYGEDMVEKGGLDIVTTLDLDIQEMSEKILKLELDKIKKLNVTNGAVIVLDPKTGEVLAMVGSKDYFDVNGGGNVNVTTRPRQPGSSIKIINYAYALANGYSTASIIDDSPITYSVPGQIPYSPKNYDGVFKGKVSLRQALAESRNIPAVKILASYGVTKMIDLGKKMGITTWEDKSRFGLSLTLGGGETKLIDLAQVYATIANGGKKPEIKIFLNESIHQEKIIDERVSYILIDILKDNYARSGEFGLNSYLVVKNHPEVAVKTGTSNDLKDNLTIGFNQNYLVAVWVGNNNSAPMSKIASGITGAAPIWNAIMSALLVNEPSIDWKVPGGIVRKNCNGKSEIFLEEDTKNIVNYCLLQKAPDTKEQKEEKKVPRIM